MVKYAPALGCLVVAALLAFGATRTSKFECDRTTCTRDGQTFPVTHVRDVRYVGNYGRHKDQGEVVLVFADGNQMTIKRESEERARERQAQVAAFFANPSGTFTIESKRNPWALLAALGLAIGGIVLGVRAYRKPTVRVTSARGRALVANKKRFLLAVALGTVVVIGVQLVVMLRANSNQGTLELHCQQRCKFQEMECLPGAKLTTMLDPGTHAIEVWNASGSALWNTQTFEIAVGETTQFVCR